MPSSSYKIGVYCTESEKGDTSKSGWRTIKKIVQGGFQGTYPIP